jgi:hypothetical protein
MRLKYTQVKDYREQTLALQNCQCALCGDIIENDAVLDHDHKTGLIRQVLHRGCNALLGKIENNMARNKMDLFRLRTWAENLVDYIQTTHTGIIHPTHKEKPMRSLPLRGSRTRKNRGKKPPKKY